MDAAVAFSGVRACTGKLQPFSYLAGTSLCFARTLVCPSPSESGRERQELVLCLEHEPEAGVVP